MRRAVLDSKCSLSLMTPSFGSSASSAASARLALDQRRAGQILAVEMQQIEHVIDQRSWRPFLRSSCNAEKSETPLSFDRGDLAIEDGVVIGRARRRPRRRPETCRPVEAGAGLQRDLAVADARLDAVAVELDLVHPAVGVGRLCARGREAGRDEVRQSALRAPASLAELFACRVWLAVLRRGVRGAGSWRSRRGGRVWPALAGLGRFALILCAPGWSARPASCRRRSRPWCGRSQPNSASPPECPGSVFLRANSSVALISSHGSCRSPGRFRIRTRCQWPLSFSPCSSKSRWPFACPCADRVGRPGAAIPDHHGAAAVLALRDGALELVVFDRMILDVDREPLLARNKARPARHRPAHHHAVEFEPQVVMQPRRVVLLDDVARSPLCAAGLAARLGGLAEVAFLPIGPRASPFRSSFSSPACAVAVVWRRACGTGRRGAAGARRAWRGLAPPPFPPSRCASAHPSG